ncbi:MAG TPA: hypothetical protein VFV28_06165 [Limnobacter sp.]|nr:hypothetical protein [Limnobacter sp.]
MTANALATRPLMNHGIDIEAQQPATRSYNPNVTRAKLAAMAVISTAGALAGAFLASSDPLAPRAAGGRELLGGSNNHLGCSPKELANIEKAKKALVISGITGASGFGAALLGACIAPAGGSAGAVVGGALISAGSTAFALSTTAVLISGIIYGVKKNDC